MAVRDIVCVKLPRALRGLCEIVCEKGKMKKSGS